MREPSECFTLAGGEREPAARPLSHATQTSWRDVRFGVTIVVLLAVGCTDANRSAPTSTDETADQASKAATLGSLSAEQTGDSNAQGALDFFALTYSEDSRVQQRALRTIIEPCMHSAGFHYSVGLADDVPRNSVAQRYGFTSLEYVVDRGYLPSPVSGGPEGTEAEFPTDPTERDRYLRALQGPEGEFSSIALTTVDGHQIGQQSVPQGCSYEAIVAVYGSAESYAQFQADDLWLQQLIGQSVQSTLADPEFGIITADWRSCLHASGFDAVAFSDPPSRLWDEPRPTRTEIEFAVADYHCRSAVDALNRIRAIDVREQEAVVSSIGDSLAEVSHRRDLVLHRSREIVDS